MTTEAPHPDMTDRKALDGLRDVSLELLRYNRQDQAYGWGETLYEIFKHLEGRLEVGTNVPAQSTPQNHTESEENQDAATNVAPEIPETIKEVMKNRPGTVFVFTGCKTVNIYQ